MNDCCEKCRFWRQHPENADAGECRRRTPTITSLGYTSWPHVQPKDWCGEFEMREDVKPCMKCGKPSGEDGVGVMENYVIVGRVCKACSEKDKPKACVVCEIPLGPGWIPVDDIAHGISGGVCKECQDEVIAVIRSAKSGNKKEKPEVRCVECMEPIGGSLYVPFIVNEETRYIHQACAERRLMMGRKIYP